MRLWERYSCRWALAGLMFSCPLAAQTIVLPSSVEVGADVLRLADLLPHNAPETLRRTSQEIELGRAPQIGSSRVYERELIANMVVAHPEIGWKVLVPDRIVVTRSGFALRPDAMRDTIRAFLQERSFSGDFPNSAYDWPEEMSATELNPALEVRSMDWNPGGQRLQFYMRCVKASACREFLVYLHVSRPMLALESREFHVQASVIKKAVQPEGSILIKAGGRARLLMQGNGIQISVAVICLESGREGAEIRVREINSRRMFRAHVIGHDLLWSKLES